MEYEDWGELVTARFPPRDEAVAQREWESLRRRLAVGDSVTGVLQRFLERRPTSNARFLTEKAVIGLIPENLFARVVWPPMTIRTDDSSHVEIVDDSAPRNT